MTMKSFRILCLIARSTSAVSSSSCSATISIAMVVQPSIFAQATVAVQVLESSGHLECDGRRVGLRIQTAFADAVEDLAALDEL